MKSHVFVRSSAIAAVTALGGLGLAGLAPSASAAPVAIPAKAYDFNGDGYQDVAIGSPNGTVGTKASAGFVSVMYGSSAGLNTAKKKVFSQDSTGIPGNAETGDHFGYSLTSADFNADGYADLAIGSPDEDTVSGGANAGQVTIVWGTPNGLTTLASGYEEFGGRAAGNRWGENLAAGKIEANGTAKLFITSPGTPSFKWIYFTAGGRSPKLGGSHNVFPKLGASGMSLQDVTNSWMATGDVTGDGNGDLVYGWYDPDWPVWDSNRQAFGFFVFPGLADGNLDLAARTGDYTEVKSVAVGDFDADGFDDVAVGQPTNATYDTLDETGGKVTVYKGSPTGVSRNAKTSIQQDSPGVPNVAEFGDAFGADIAAGDVNKDGRADLAVGGPNEDIGSIVDAGNAWVLFGSASGLTGAGAQEVSQNTSGVPDTSERNDHFGYQLTLLDNNRDGFADLTIGAPHENGTDGAITFVKGKRTGILPVSGSLMVGTGTFGVTGKKAELGRRLGQ